MVIVFIGPPGSGKGTQAQILKDSVLPNLNILTVSSLLKNKSSDGSILGCLLYTSPSPRDRQKSRMPSSA